MKKILQVNTPADYCAHVGLECRHPLVAVIDFGAISPMPSSLNSLGVFGLFMHSKLRDDLTYGSEGYDTGNGTLVCVGPGQIYGREDDGDLIHLDGWGLLIHPRMFVGTHLERSIRDFTFFDYSAKEALLMEDKEGDILTDIIGKIKAEVEAGPIDSERDAIIVSYISALLHYCQRFYNRQFSSMKAESDDMLVRLNSLISDYFESGRQFDDGLPTVQYFAEQMCMSPSYFSDMVKKTTGDSAGSLIRAHIIRRAKNLLVASGNVSQVAYDLGFDYPQHFSRMFKKQTGLTPKEYISSGK